jgi:hypothetical protein
MDAKIDAIVPQCNQQIHPDDIAIDSSVNKINKQKDRRVSNGYNKRSQSGWRKSGSRNCAKVERFSVWYLNY